MKQEDFFDFPVLAWSISVLPFPFLSFYGRTRFFHTAVYFDASLFPGVTFFAQFRSTFFLFPPHGPCEVFPWRVPLARFFFFLPAVSPPFSTDPSLPAPMPPSMLRVFLHLGPPFANTFSPPQKLFRPPVGPSPPLTPTERPVPPIFEPFLVEPFPGLFYSRPPPRIPFPLLFNGKTQGLCSFFSLTPYFTMRRLLHHFSNPWPPTFQALRCGAKLFF